MAPPNKGLKYPAEPLSSDEAVRLLEMCSRRAPTGVRNAALIVILWRGGLRISEALALEVRDVDLDVGAIHVRHGKGGTSRTVGLDPGACAVVQRWVARRAKLGLDGRGPLFTTLRGASVSAPYVRMMLTRTARRAGVEKRVHPHGLRHTMAVEMLREGFDVVTIGRQLGHKTLSATEVYLRHLSPEALLRAVRSRFWSAPTGRHTSTSR
jgi:site-specific recombinase XerD